jgi:hypothetical protein
MVCLVVSKFTDISEKIIPFLDKYLVQGIKLADYQDFKRAAELIKAKSHLTLEGLNQLRAIKAGMNTQRDYIKLHSNLNENLSATKLIESKSQLKYISNIQKRSFSSLGSSYNGVNIKSSDRIGPHNLDVISVIIGSLLGHSLLDKRGDFGLCPVGAKAQGGVRIIFIQSGCNVEYLM